MTFLAALRHLLVADPQAAISRPRYSTCPACLSLLRVHESGGLIPTDQRENDYQEAKALAAAANVKETLAEMNAWMLTR